MAKKSQIEKFREAAAALGDKVDEAKFDETLRKMAHGTPKEQEEATDEMAELLGQKDPNADFGRNGSSEDGSPEAKAKRREKDR